MLTADLVQARRRGTELRLVPLDAAGRARAEALAATLLEVAAAHVGRPRAELDEVCAAVRATAPRQRLADGLCKLVLDRCTFEADAAVLPEELRGEVFWRSCAAWRALAPGRRLDRAAVLAGAAAALGLEPEALERGLYADLRAAHLLRAAPPLSARRLVEAYELAQAQAVLLRAVRVVVELWGGDPGAHRVLFRRLKFLRLLHTIAPRPAGGYRVEIDGPYSLFESGTKYGLALALALPAVRACARWTLVADVHWGAARTPLRFQLAGEADGAPDEAPALADDVAVLLRGLEALASPWRIGPATSILDLPGAGLCVPDLVFERGGQRVFVEVLGYWSRDAVWKRVELVQRGLAERIVFAVGQHLRVSQAALEEGLPGALYVYKRTMQPRAVLERVEAVAAAR